MLFASHNWLSSLPMIVDANGYQAMGRTEVIWPGSIRRKPETFGFKTADVDGHDHVAGERR